MFTIFSKRPKKSCDLDAIPAGLLIDILPTLLPTITKNITISPETGRVPRSMKKAIVSPLLKKLTPDKDVLKNYRPVSNLTVNSQMYMLLIASAIFFHVFRGEVKSIYNGTGIL